MSRTKRSQYSVAVGPGLVIRQFWLRLLALSQTSCMHSLIYSVYLDASHMSNIRLGYGCATATTTEKEEREQLASFLCQLFILVIIWLTTCIEETTLYPQRGRTFSEWSKKTGDIWLEFPFVFFWVGKNCITQIPFENINPLHLFVVDNVFLTDAIETISMWKTIEHLWRCYVNALLGAFNSWPRNESHVSEKSSF